MAGPLSGAAAGDLRAFEAPPVDPFVMLEEWLHHAALSAVREPLSMTLATASAEGAVSARTVDVKRVDARGLVFGTSRASRKGADLSENPRAALQVYWRETMQQLRFEGRIEQLNDDESDALFAARSPASRAATAVARQSAVFDESATLADLGDAARALQDEQGPDVPRPADWVALRLVPLSIEFWQGSRDRLHRRLRYRREGDAWEAERLQP
ncbi:pyridoxal 5'-phosphate synthase [Microbacterium sp. NPDC089189]|uniref:pyridoxal 5'-phosphate synthase n=1 Tax=Microbacterium sp. NPDC089189 TaxID=3154972 RepID=UPI00342C4217